MTQRALRDRGDGLHGRALPTVCVFAVELFHIGRDPNR
jgi:hypothetical protein